MFIQEDYFRNIFNTVRGAILILDQDMRVLSANRSFLTIFKVDAASTIGSLLYSLGNRQWDIPNLRILLDEILPHNDTVDDYEIEHDFESIGHKTMLLNACKIREKKDQQPIILLSIEDITERKQLEEMLTESEKSYRRIFDTANDGIVLLEKHEGHIVHANPAAENMLGYSADEYQGKMLEDIGVPIDMSDFQKIMDGLNKNGILNFDDVAVTTKSGSSMEADIYLVDRARTAQCNIRDVTERKRSEELLKKEEIKYRELAESISDIFFAMDQDLRYTYWNKSTENLTGISAKDAIGKNFADIFPDNEITRKLQNVYLNVIRTNTSQRLTSIYPGGRNIIHEISAYPSRNGVSVFVKDITERKQAEEMLNAARKRAQEYLDITGVLIVALDSGGRIELINKKGLEILGYKEDEVTDQNWFDLCIPGDIIENVRGVFSKLMTGDIEPVEYFENPIITKEGKERIVAFHNTLLRNVSGEVSGILFSGEDITKQKQAEKDLQAALVIAHDEKARSEAIMAAMGEGLSIQDTNFNIIYENQVQKDLIGDHTGEHCFSAYEQKEHRCEGCPVEMAFRDGAIHKTAREVTTAKGTLHVEITASALRDIQGNIVAGIEVIRDVTEQRKLEAQLLQSQKMEAVGTLAGGIAHDFNNILNVIIGYSTMVQETLPVDSSASEQMAEVLIAADRAATLTKRLLIFSRKQVVDVKPVNINELILGLQKMIARVFRENIDVVLTLADESLPVLADAGQIEQVLMNLAVNARDAMPDGGRLTIATAFESVDEEYVAAYGYGKPGKYALVSFSDSGQGIDAATQEKIFEPFFTTKGIGEGTGLGLAISYGIIKQHGGYIKVYSEPGQGAVFKILLPLSEDPAAPEKPAEGIEALKGGTETILVAEDDVSLRNLTRIVLESFGYTVLTAENGEEAILKFMENREAISLAILDMIMPKKNGCEVREAINNASPEMKILFTSGYTMDILKSSDLTDAGINFISKPFQPQVLLKKVREILDRVDLPHLPLLEGKS